MKVLKGVTIAVLSLLLFLSLSVFGTAFTLKATLLDPDFFVAEVQKIDITSLAGELADRAIAGQLPAEAQFLNKAVQKTIVEQDAWIREQSSAALYSAYDYLLGKTETLSVTIQLEPLKQGLRGNVREAFMESPPAELAGVPPALMEQYFDQYYQEIAAQVPARFTFDQGMIPPDIMTKLELARQYISYFQRSYYILIAFMLLLAVGIVLVNRNVRGSTRTLGADLLVYGGLEFAGVFMARRYMTQLPLPGDLPQALQAWLPQFLADLLGPLQVFSLGLLIGGVALLAVSFLYRRGRQEED